MFLRKTDIGHNNWTKAVWIQIWAVNQTSEKIWSVPDVSISVRRRCQRAMVSEPNIYVTKTMVQNKKNCCQKRGKCTNYTQETQNVWKYLVGIFTYKGIHGAIEWASSRAPLPSLIRHFAWLQGYDLRQSTSTQLIPSFPADRPGSRSDQPCPALPLLWYIAGHWRQALDVGNYYCYYYFYYYYYRNYYYYYCYYYYCRDPMSSTWNPTVLYGVQVLQTIVYYTCIHVYM